MLDILIIGSGGAGLSAALSAKQEGANLLVVGKSYPTASQTSMAQGGMNAALGNVTPDSTQAHMEDTLKSAHSLSNQNMVKQLCEDAPKSIAWLDKLGVSFDRTEESKVAQRQLGGASSKRACYAQDYTGLKILHTLYDNCLKEGIEMREEYFLLNLIVEEKTVLGAIFLDIVTGEVKEIRAKATIIATGGYASLYKNYTTNSEGATGDGIAAVLRAGGSLSDMEFVQFHPTALKGSSTLISESARGEGGYLVNAKEERFIDELLPRDVVARAIAEQITNGEEVFLDLRHLGEEKLLKLMPQEVRLCKLHENVDPAKELVPIKPVAHYSMGGIDVNENLEVTGLKNCYAVGECSNAKVHGANRLGGNSLLEIVSLGRKAGTNAVGCDCHRTDIENQNQLTNNQEYIQGLLEEYPWEQNFYQIQDELGKKFYQHAGIVRDNTQLNNLLNELRVIKADLDNMGIGDKNKENNTNLVEFLQFQNMLEIGEVVLDAALVRDESRGAHFKTAFPSKDDKLYKAHSVYWIEENVLQNKLVKVINECK
ncbi:MAG: Succinate dehydrogenase flavoprotein subunit (EC [uncultured Sulfurovum sp.]|uniref:Succinate dehydrogenase flavoprotein subunit (EC) n=1 Tax=uncultured Sulfurovum sp. TaxID=269237 RepID=A0A6S6RVL6_9BACT|nr:MAG: Succinate dehydrogenase flavoprotein subunit (EC [uncultured Sulfurovum sp.]